MISDASKLIQSYSTSNDSLQVSLSDGGRTCRIRQLRCVPHEFASRALVMGNSLDRVYAPASDRLFIDAPAPAPLQLAPANPMLLAARASRSMVNNGVL